MLKKICLVQSLLLVSVLAFLAAGCSEQTETPSAGKTAKETGKKVDLDPGLWEITSKMESPGMPMAIPATTVKQCMTEEDLVPQQTEQSQSDCEVVNLKIKDNTVTYKMKCSSGGTDTTSSAVLTYRGSSMEGVIDMEVSGPTSMKMKTTLSGKRVGPCK